jgi:hypothetical protein
MATRAVTLEELLAGNLDSGLRAGRRSATQAQQESADGQEGSADPVLAPVHRQILTRDRIRTNSPLDAGIRQTDRHQIHLSFSLMRPESAVNFCAGVGQIKPPSLATECVVHHTNKPFDLSVCQQRKLALAFGL